MTSRYPTRYVRRRASDDRFSFRELARACRVGESAFSGWLAGDRPLPARCWDPLDRELALGERNGARHPIYVVGRVGTSGAWAPVLDEAGRVGYFDFLRRQLAFDTVAMLRSAGFGSDLMAAPCWPSWLTDRPYVWLDEQVSAAPQGRTDDEQATCAAVTILDYFRSVIAQGEKNAGRSQPRRAAATAT